MGMGYSPRYSIKSNALIIFFVFAVACNYPIWSPKYLTFHFRSLFIKCKIEPLSMALSQLTEGLKCYGLLQVMRKNSSLFHFVFCPNDKLIWNFKCFTDMLQSVFSDDGSNKKVKEVTVYKRFADLIERRFLDGK